MRVVGLIVLLAICAGAARGAELDEQQRGLLFTEAQRAYDDGVALLRSRPGDAQARFRESAAKFELLTTDGIANGRLLYNLANARLQAGQLGEAILNYRRAERLVPGDPRLQENLRYARTLVRSRIEPDGRRALKGVLLGWHERTAVRTRFTVFVIAYGVFWVVAFMRLLARVPGWPYVLAVCAVIWVATGMSVWIDTAGGGPVSGVVLGEDTIVRKGGGEGFEPQFAEPLSTGVEFVLREQRGDWYHIELADGKSGWIRADEAALL